MVWHWFGHPRVPSPGASYWRRFLFFFVGTFLPWESSSSTDSWLLRLLFVSWCLAGLGSALASVSDMISVDEVGALCWDELCMPSLSFGCLRLDPSLSLMCICFCTHVFVLDCVVSSSSVFGASFCLRLWR